MTDVKLIQCVIWAFIFLGTILFFFFCFLFIGLPHEIGSMSFGVTWSSPYAFALGISSDEGLGAVLDDLGIRHIRIPVYWALVERSPGRYDWEEVDRQLDMIARRGGAVTLAIGQKVPRWPECWLPEWVKTASSADRERMLMEFLKETVRHTASHPAVKAFQVENEPLFPFGDCPKMSLSGVKHEIAFVRSLDRSLGFSHAIYTTDSGEFTPWLGFSRIIDGLGVSVYRSTRNEFLGVRKYHFIPPWFYQRKAWLIRPWQKHTYISEFQMEPWVIGSMKNASLKHQFETFDLEQMRKNFWFVKRSGFREIDLWGAEWWYWMKTRNGHPEFWDAVRSHRYPQFIISSS